MNQNIIYSAVPEPTRTRTERGLSHEAGSVIAVMNVGQPRTEEQRPQLSNAIRRICSIEDLPPELLRCIFLFAAPAFDADEEVPAYEDEERCAAHPGHLVARVCRLWRNIALQLPALWTTVDFNDGFQQAEAYLELSRNAPVTISLDLTKPIRGQSEDIRDSDMDEDVERIFLPLIMPHVSRWRSLRFSSDDAHSMLRVLVAMSKCGPAPLLEELLLSRPVARSRVEIGYMPLLALRGIYLNWAESRCFSGLHRLELAYHAEPVRPEYKEFARILNSSPNLHTLILRNSGPFEGLDEWMESMGLSEDDDWLPLIVVLRSLRKLVLDFTSYRTEFLLKCLDFGSLEELEISSPSGSPSSFMRSLVQRPEAFAGLRSLSVSGLRTRDYVIEFYAVMPNLTTLTLDFRRMLREWYRNARRPPLARFGGFMGHAAGMFFPRLDTLVTTGVNGRMMCALVGERRDAGMPLRCVRMHAGDRIRPDRLAWLAENVEVFGLFRHPEDGYVATAEEDENSDAVSDDDSDLDEDE
ncbi:hypothetical protein BKA93DRAFT_787395 [Sparassis latifolia]